MPADCQYLTLLLVPMLRAGDVVMMSNLSSHKVSAVHKTIGNAKVRTLYLPSSYSLDLNPIELGFSKLKQLMRTTKHPLVNDLW